MINGYGRRVETRFNKRIKKNSGSRSSSLEDGETGRRTSVNLVMVKICVQTRDVHIKSLNRHRLPIGVLRELSMRF